MTATRNPKTYGHFTCSDCGRQLSYVIEATPEIAEDEPFEIVCFRCTSKRKAARRLDESPEGLLGPVPKEAP